MDQKLKMNKNEIWAFWADEKNGPVRSTPQLAERQGEEFDYYWLGGRSCLEGFHKTNLGVTFASKNKKEVEIFIEGFRACQNLLNRCV